MLIGRFVFHVWAWPMGVAVLLIMAQMVFAVPLSGKLNDLDEVRERAKQFEAEFRDRYNPDRWPDDTESSD